MSDPHFPCMECMSRGARQDFSLRDLEEHLGREHFGITFYTCPKCKEDFVTKSKISEHIKTACKMERLPKTEEFTKNILHYDQEVLKLIERCINQSIVYRIENPEKRVKNEEKLAEKEPKIKENNPNLAGNSKIPVKFEPPDENRQMPETSGRIPPTGPATNGEGSIRSETRVEFKQEPPEGEEGPETENLPENQELQNQEPVASGPNLPTVLQTLLKIHFPKDSSRENVEFGPDPQWNEDHWISMGPEANTVIQNDATGPGASSPIASMGPGKNSGQKRIRGPRKSKSKPKTITIDSNGPQKVPEANKIAQNGPEEALRGLEPVQLASEPSTVIPAALGAKTADQIAKEGDKQPQLGLETILPESETRKLAVPAVGSGLLGVRPNLEPTVPQESEAAQETNQENQAQAQLQEISNQSPRINPMDPTTKEVNQATIQSGPETIIEPGKAQEPVEIPQMAAGTDQIVPKSSNQATSGLETIPTRPGRLITTLEALISVQKSLTTKEIVSATPKISKQPGVRPGAPLTGFTSSYMGPATKETDQAATKISAQPGAPLTRSTGAQKGPGTKQAPTVVPTVPPTAAGAEKSGISQTAGPGTKQTSPIDTVIAKSGSDTRTNPKNGAGSRSKDTVPSLLSLQCLAPINFGPGNPGFGPPPFPPPYPFGMPNPGQSLISGGGPTLFPSSMRLSGPYSTPPPPLPAPFFPPGPSFTGPVGHPPVSAPQPPEIPKTPDSKGPETKKTTITDPITNNGPDSREQAAMIINSPILEEMMKSTQKSKASKRRERRKIHEELDKSPAKKRKEPSEPVQFPPSKGLIEPGFKIPKRSSFTKRVKTPTKMAEQEKDAGDESVPAGDYPEAEKDLPGNENRAPVPEPTNSEEIPQQILIKLEPFEADPNRTPPASPAPEPIPVPLEPEKLSPTSSHPRITPPDPETMPVHPRITPPEEEFRPRMASIRSYGEDFDDLELFDEVEGDEEDEVLVYDYGQPIPRPIGVKEEPETVEEMVEEQLEEVEEARVLYVDPPPKRKKTKKRKLPSLLDIPVNRPRGSKRNRIQPPSPEPLDEQEEEEEYFDVQFPDHICEYVNCCQDPSNLKSPCPFCNGHHLPSNCATVTNLWERKVACYFNHYCYRCLGKHPQFKGAKCKKMTCDFCQKSSHATALCTLPENTSHRLALAAHKLQTSLPLTPEILENMAQRRMDLGKVAKGKNNNPRLIIPKLH